ncbi:MAG: Stp1/IreP family PP2C-type Ser/Thr phosphatase [Acidiferrobacterales bacterium]
MAMEIRMSGLTHQGMVRTNNEDSISTLDDLGVAILADGMGGHQAGEVASSMAVEMVKQFFTETMGNGDSTPIGEQMLESVELANTAVFELSQQRPECAGMGTTLVVCAFVSGKIITAHVGDSRLYRLRENNLEQITQDHSVVQELVSRGFMSPEEANNSMNKNLVTKALGIEAAVEADLDEQDYQAGDLYLLCSDGLSDVVSDGEIEKSLIDCQGDIDVAAKTLVEQANTAGGPDNISVVLVRVFD